MATGATAAILRDARLRLRFAGLLRMTAVCVEAALLPRPCEERLRRNNQSAAMVCRVDKGAPAPCLPSSPQTEW
jgi:hypothetical protein